MKLHVFFLVLAGFLVSSFSYGKTSYKFIAGNNPAVDYVGRTLADADGSVSFDWTGTYFRTLFTGGYIAMKASETGASYYDVFVDGKRSGTVKVSGKDTLVTLISGTGKGLHELRVQKRSEGEFGKTTIHNFLLAASGILKPVSERSQRHIEFIGNSITCGYGVEGKDRDDPFLVETENSGLSYAAIISRFFKADYTLIAHSGRGAARNYGDSLRVSKVTMKDRMMNTFDMDLDLKWDFKAYRPGLVVINLGSNDFSGEPHPYRSEFVKAYKQIISQLRENYGEIPVLCICPPTVTAPVYSYWEQIKEEMKDSKVYIIRLYPEWVNNTTDLGGAWHPGYAGQKKIAMFLIPYISTITGWGMENNVIK